MKIMEAFHQGISPIISGQPLEYATGAMILVHGRGADAHSIMKITQYLETDSLALIAPQASGNNWYPQRFLSPTIENEPWLSSALESIRNALNLIISAGIPTEKTILLGFSQGACLALEFAARNPLRYGAVIGLSGGLIGDDHESSALGRSLRKGRTGNGALAGTPVFLGCSDIDTHIPRYRVEESARTLLLLGGQVDLRFYPGMDHTINEDEIKAVQTLIDRLCFPLQ
jgi:predicted esterase